MNSEDKPPRPPGPPGGLAPIKEVASSDLLGRSGELHIRHEGRLYRLRRTRQGRLILTT